MLDHPSLYRAIFLTSFFAFLRISNVAPYSAKSFDQSIHLTKSDIIFGPPGAHIIIKWSKTLQTRDKYQIVQIPSLVDKLICPVQAIQNMLTLYPRSRNAPLFMSPLTMLSVTQGQIRQALAMLLSFLHVPHQHINFHAFRRSGVTLAFNSNVSLQNLKVHGGWKLDAIWSYLKTTTHAAGAVARSFQSSLNPIIPVQPIT